MADNPDDEQGDKPAADFNRLPDFPGGDGIGNPIARVSAYRWAGYMIDIWGGDAQFHALSGILHSIDANDDFHKRGWRNISDAMADWARQAGPEDAVH